MKFFLDTANLDELRKGAAWESWMALPPILR